MVSHVKNLLIICATHLWCRYTSSKQLYQIPRIQDSCRVVCLSSSFDRHTALHQIQCARDAELLQRACDHWPSFLEIDLAIFGEESRKRRFLREGTDGIIGRSEWLNLLLVRFHCPWRRHVPYQPSTCQCRPCPRAYRVCASTASFQSALERDRRKAMRGADKLDFEMLKGNLSFREVGGSNEIRGVGK
jgi:hypothetical protein